MEGELDKWTNYATGWKKRYCVVKGEIFYYYNNKGEPVKGKAHLATSKIEEYSKDSNKFELDTGCAYFYFRASSMEEKKSWLNALKKAKLSADQQLNKGAEPVEGVPMPISTALPDRMIYLVSLANSLAKGNSNFIQFITDNYEVEQDETAKKLTSMLNSHKEDNNKFQKEVENLVAGLNNFTLHFNSLNQFLKASNQIKYTEQYMGVDYAKSQPDIHKQSKEVFKFRCNWSRVCFL